MTAYFNTYEGKDEKEFPELVYENVITVWFEDQKWYIRTKEKGIVTLHKLDLEDYCITYVHK